MLEGPGVARISLVQTVNRKWAYLEKHFKHFAPRAQPPITTSGIEHKLRRDWKNFLSEKDWASSEILIASIND